MTNPPYRDWRKRVFESDDLSAIDRLVFLALVEHVSTEQTQAGCYKVWPSHRKLSEMTGASESAVYRSLKKLSDIGWITIRSRRTKSGDPDSNAYLIVPIVTEKGPPSTGKGPPSTQKGGSFHTEGTGPFTQTNKHVIGNAKGNTTFSAGDPAESNSDNGSGGISMKDMTKLYGIVERHFKKTKGQGVKWTPKNKAQLKQWATTIAGDEAPEEVIRVVLANWPSLAAHIRSALGYSFAPDEFKAGYLLMGAGQSVDWYRQHVAHEKYLDADKAKQAKKAEEFKQWKTLASKTPAPTDGGPNMELLDILSEDEA